MSYIGVISGMAVSEEDVCKTQMGTATVAVPYINSAELTMAEPLPTIIVSGVPAINIESTVILSDGDEEGALGGILSSDIMGECEFLSGSSTLLLNGAPAVLMGMSATMQNSENAPGNVTLVDQFIAQAN